MPPNKTDKILVSVILFIRAFQILSNSFVSQELYITFDARNMRNTHLSLSPSLSFICKQHCKLNTWVKVESGETQKWFGRVRI